MLVRYSHVDAENAVDVLTSTELFDQSSDVDEPEADGVLAIVCETKSGDEGNAVTGTERELHGWLNRARTQLVAKTGGPRVMAVLELSTGHLPKKVCDNLDVFVGVTAYETSYGWLMPVPANARKTFRDGEVPAEVWVLWEYAERFGAPHIMFDRDAPLVDGLPSWEW